jgi:excisionase family DNA binding protein
MATILSTEVMTLEEAAEFLRLPQATVRHHAARLAIPARQIGEEWRFSRHALQEWLRGPSGKQVLLSQAGAFGGDKEDLAELRTSIYRDRGRPEVEG